MTITDLAQARQTLDALNQEYESLHTAKEDAFWQTMMSLGPDPEAARASMNQLHVQLQRFLGDSQRLQQLRALEASPLAQQLDEPRRTALRGWVRTLEAHAIESEEARLLSEEIVAEESALASARGQMELGYQLPGQALVEASLVELRLMVQNDSDEARRQAAWEGLRSLEGFVLAHGFLDLIKKRNRLGRLLGGEDYYDARVRRVEGMSKAEIFAMLDDLEEKTRDSAQRAIEQLRQDKGEGALRPWNTRHLIAGDITRRKDPYFPFAASLERWGRSFAALGIDYQGAHMVLDLVVRKGKYENGFMHGPVVAWRSPEGLQEARIHFTANAVPGVLGSGHRATQTLFHEGGHAAHFANVDMPAPCFGQEFAPTSVAFAETQSMFLDSLLQDADWQRRYATDAQGQPIPMELIEEDILQNQPFAALSARAMLSVCYGEKALYEIPEEELSAERVLQTLREVEQKMLFLPEGSYSPVLSIPHLLSGESSAYYHGYVLARMAVSQTRRFFQERDGHLLDNPRIGPALREHYWTPGNSRTFADFVEQLTGQAPNADAYAQELNHTAQEAIAQARAQVQAMDKIPAHTGPIALNTSLRIIHGDEVITEGQDFDQCARDFAAWITALEQSA